MTLQISRCKNKWYKYGRFNGGVCTNTLFSNRHRHIWGYIYILCQLKAFQSDTWSPNFLTLISTIKNKVQHQMCRTWRTVQASVSHRVMSVREIKLWLPSRTRRQVCFLCPPHFAGSRICWFCLVVYTPLAWDRKQKGESHDWTRVAVNL